MSLLLMFQSVVATIAATEQPDRAVGIGQVVDSGAIAANDNADAATASGAVMDAATIAATETADAASASGSVVDSATASASDHADSATASGAVADSATASATETRDTAAASGAIADGAAITAAERQDTGAATAALTDAGAATLAEQADNVSGAASVAATATISATESADTASGVGTVHIAANVSLLQMWTVTASVQPNEDFDTVLTSISFFEADGVTPQSLAGIVFTPKLNGQPVFASATNSGIVVNGNQLSFAVPVAALGLLSGSYLFTLLAFDGVRTRSIFANSWLTVGAPASFGATTFGQITTSINVLNTPNGWGRQAA
ncbi:hypothetical protein [Rhodoblastus sp.]|uniref:hypothetical protein n=1 Tax=Rhodoblastus sp. TaxID=1962975 RepID=UPI003F9C1846